LRDLSSPNYRPDIDGLRAVAISLVLLFHAFPKLCPGGFVGVDIFFVISGYLITGLILRDVDRGRFSLMDFYARRFRRIVPALAVVLAVVLAVGCRVLLPNELVSLGVQVAAAATFTLNFVLLRQVGYFDAAASAKPLLHLWSLAVEEQYYVLWPPLLVLVARLKRRRGWLFGALFVLSFGAMLWSRRPFQAFYMLPFRFWELLLGASLTLAEQHRRRLALLVPARLRAIMPACGGVLTLMLIGGTALLLGPGQKWPGAVTLLPTLGAALLIGCGPGSWLNRRVLGNRVAVAIGLISYPLYLWHWPLLSFARLIDGQQPPVWVRAGVLAASVVLAWLTWVLIERPVASRLFARLARRRRDQAYVVTAVLALGLLAGAGAFVDSRGGFPQRLAQVQGDFGEQGFLAYMNAMNLPWAGCPAGNGSFCRAQHSDATYALIGDSHAEQYIPGLFVTAPADGGWMFLTRSNCPATRYLEVWSQSLGDNQCGRSNEQKLAFLASDHAVRTVVVASLWERYLTLIVSGITRFSSSHYTGTPSQLYAQGLAALVDALHRQGKIVVLMMDDPGLLFDPTACVRASLLPRVVAHAALCSFSRKAYEARVGDYRAMIYAIARSTPGVLVYDGTGLFCQDDTCSPFRDGRSLYRDTDHLSVYGSRLAAARLLRWLADRGV
jgi:peptidoglycan/LPS O-acetylase OafA/YrhL